MMRRGWRFSIAAAALSAIVAMSPAAAQEATPPPATTNSADPVGPPQLRGFSLEGRVTRPGGEQAPAAQPPAPRQTPPSQPAARAPQTRPPQPTAQPEPTFTPSRPERGTQDPSPVAADQLPSSDNLHPAPSLLPPEGGLTSEEPLLDSPYVAPPVPEPASTTAGFSLLPWLFAAALGLVAFAAFQFFRRRSRLQLAGGPADNFDVAAEPASRPPEPLAGAVAPPAPTPAPPSIAGGVVSTRLRPWLEIGFTPDRLVIDGDKATLEFTLQLSNSGNAPAAQISIQAGLFNAGPMQDQQINAFFARPPGDAGGIPVIPPQQQLAMQSSVAVPLRELQPLQVEGRSLLVPMIAFNGLYRAGSTSKGQTSVSYLVGKDTGGEKLAPFRLDLGPRVFRGLAARQHDLRIRS